MNVFVDAGKYLISFDITTTLPCILVVDVYKNDGAYVDSFALYSDSENILGMFLKRMPDISYDDIRFFISEIEKLIKNPIDRISFLKKMDGWKVSDSQLKELGIKTNHSNDAEEES
ncbi:MAG TPA: hypothetical protein ACFYEF_12700 [Candidatus Wunengus sp. YC63]|uniref:hypothetical protein n=1 Tax=unclassified Candidatus Wunengus TaxID=3367695 RepID=UPI002713CF22|nr:hypothetical protein [Candidatus Brocadiales bacterium]